MTRKKYVQVQYKHIFFNIFSPHLVEYMGTEAMAIELCICTHTHTHTHTHTDIHIYTYGIG
jgi:hypothetical protein